MKSLIGSLTSLVLGWLVLSTHPRKDHSFHPLDSHQESMADHESLIVITKHGCRPAAIDSRLNQYIDHEFQAASTSNAEEDDEWHQKANALVFWLEVVAINTP